MMQSYDVVVVGAGIVGSACVAQLAAAGRWQIAWVAPAADLSTASCSTTGVASFDRRVVALTEASRAQLTHLGCWPALQARACPYYGMRVWDGEGNGAISFDAAELRVPALGHIVENRALLHALDQVQAGSNGITRFSHKVEQLVQGDGGRITGITLDDGRCLQAPLVIAADGADSALRTLAGFDVREWSYGQRALVATVKTEKPHQNIAWQRFMTTGPLAFLPLQTDQSGDSGHYSSIVWSADTAQAEALMRQPNARFLQSLGRSFEYRLGNIDEVSERFSLPLLQRHATRYVMPGLALVGDSAHSIHPLAGQGVNLGLLDVACLTDELQRLAGRGVALDDASGLRRYERQRMPHNLAMMTAMEGFKRSFGARDPAWVWARNRALDSADQWALLKQSMARYAMGLIG